MIFNNATKIYFWNYSSFVIKFISYFITTPYLAKSKELFGIYSICISIMLFFNYIDLGFLSSSEKFATESYIKNDIDNEIKMIGFGFFILCIFSILLMIAFLIFSINPNYLFRDLQEPKIASELFLILFLFTPVILFEKIINIIYNIRLKSFVPKKILLFTSLISIVPLNFFFNTNNYYIVEYFLFTQILNLLAIFYNIYYAKVNFKYNFLSLFKNIKFDSTTYRITSKLAYSGLFGTIMWIIYYELDRVVIAKYFGQNSVAIFTVSLTFLTLFRTIFGILFTPFSTISNYYIGLNDDKGFNDFLKNLLILTAPLTILPCIIVSLLSKQILINWLTEDYIESVELTMFFSSVFIFSFITYTSNFYLIAKEKLQESILISFIIPIIYWLGIYLFYNKFGLLSFPYFKLISTFLNTIFYMHILAKYIKIDYVFYFKSILLPMSPSFLILGLFFYLLQNNNIVFSNLFSIILSGIFLFFLTLSSFIFLNKNYIPIFKDLISKLNYYP